MEPEGSLPHSQVPATCLYPKPARSSPYPTSHFLIIRLNIFFPSTPGTSKWSLSPGFPHQSHVCTSPLPHTSYMTHQSHSSWFDLQNNNGWGVQISQLFIMWFSHLPCYLVPLWPKYSLEHRILKNTLSLRSSLNVSYQVTNPYTTTGKIKALFILIFKVLDSKLESLCYSHSKIPFHIKIPPPPIFCCC